MPGKAVKVLFIGDVVGRPGRQAVRGLLPDLIGGYSIDLVIANGENAAGGFGITPAIAEELLALKIDILTSGNHIWDKKEMVDYIRDKEWLLRPANYPPGAPGFGSTVIKTITGVQVGVINLCGRVFMDNLDCPFRVGEEIVNQLRAVTPLIVVDMHAEATSEKAAMGWFLDGKVSAVIGTHTHVQTADERVLPQGTAFITDIGMTGSIHSVIGIQKELILGRFLTQMPRKFEVATKGVQLQGVVISIDPDNGKAMALERVKVDYDNPRY